MTRTVQKRETPKHIPDHPSNTRGDERRERIIEAAARLFEEKRGAAPSFGSIASAAGVTRTALYYYFPTKFDLIRAVMMRTVDWEWWIGAIAAGSDEPTFGARVRILLNECVERSLATQGAVYSHLLNTAHDDEDVREGIRSYSAHMRSAVRGMVDDCVSQGALPPDVDPEVVVDGVVGLVWCVASALVGTTSPTLIRQVRRAIELAAGDASVWS